MEIWSCKTEFKGCGFTISEFLTKQRHTTFMAAREKFGVTRCWTSEGFIYVLGPNDIRHRITTMNELNKISLTLKPTVIAKATKPKRTLKK